MSQPLSEMLYYTLLDLLTIEVTLAVSMYPLE